MSEYVLTPNLGLYKPAVDADEDHWGDHLNLNADKLDSVLSTTSSGLFLPLAGGQMKGALLLNATAPVDASEAAPKRYVDALRSYADTTFLKLSGGTMTGSLHLKPGTPPAADEAVPKSYVDAAITAGTGNYVLKTGDTMTGDLNIVASYASVILKKSAAGAGYANQLVGYTGGNARWNLQVGDSTAESGSDLGSDFAIHRYNDAGAYIDTPFTIARATGRVNITRDGLTVFGHDRMTLDAGTGHAIIRYNNNLHQWWAGNDPADSGNWNVYDQNAERTVLKCQTDGNVYAPLGFYSGYIESYGYIVSRNNTIVRHGNNPTLTVHNTQGYAGGMMCEAGGRLTFGFTGGAGENLDWQMFFDRGGYAQFRYTVNFPNIYVSDRVNTYQSMNRSGIFRVADNDAYYMERSSSDGHWRWVDNWGTKFTVYNYGDIRAEGTAFAAGHHFCWGNHYANGQWDCYFGGSGHKYTQYQGGGWYWDWDNSNGNLWWNTASGWGLLLQNDRVCQFPSTVYIQGQLVGNSNNIGMRYDSGSYSNGHNVLFGYNNVYSGAGTASFNNGGAVVWFANASDARLKTNIAPADFDCLGTARRIPLHQYDWVDVPDCWGLKKARRKLKLRKDPRRRIGVVAQEVIKVFPEGVVAGDNFETHLGRIWSLDHNNMIALLIGAVQQLSERIEELEAA